MAHTPDDKLLMVRYRDGEVEAFEVLYARHKGPLYRYFLRRGLAAESAAELAQEVWMKIISSKNRYQPSAKFTTYMYRLAHNCCIDLSRRSAHKIAQQTVGDDIDVARLPATAMADPEAQAIRNQSVAQFRSALADLPDEQREVFILKQEAGLSLADIAYVTGVSTETAKSRLRYAFGKLRQQLIRNRGKV
ncbi:MAG: RNA polymerase sigma factor [Gammaproteobacteria bacterium]|jgi:RNA polymerase sigma-70 factor (ECF subfamily)|nr:RNA polymerase sigma factor [Gammaproteobacteria bacterium]MDP7419164.1 RNA polymerase sigma factor [Gammaproteobacteria bacterium]MDP7659679.1 RNA polymerase sigma factor [Gammaproteobacteria bacterium]HJP38116.1 RNA polymerase sigma factor [Gammaproteobacteria bacterium]